MFSQFVAPLVSVLAVGALIVGVILIMFVGMASDRHGYCRVRRRRAKMCFSIQEILIGLLVAYILGMITAMSILGSAFRRGPY
jgi:hypothetical protein